MDIRVILERGHSERPILYPVSDRRLMSIEPEVVDGKMRVSWFRPINAQLTYEIFDAKKLIHDGVVLSLGWREEEKSIHEVYGWPGQAQGAARKTPDIIHNNTFVEVGTSINKANAMDYYQDKIAKYSSAIDSLTGIKPGFLETRRPELRVIIVSQNGVYTNLFVNQDEVDTMVSVAESGRIAVSSLMQLGVIPPDEMSERQKDFLRKMDPALSLPPYTKQGELFINENLEKLVEESGYISYVELYKTLSSKVHLDLSPIDSNKQILEHRLKVKAVASEHVKLGMPKPNPYKPISIMPFVTCEPDEVPNHLNYLPHESDLPEGHSIEMNIWIKALTEARNNPNRFEQKSETFEPLSSTAPEDKARRKRFQTVVLSLTDAQRRKLYLSGVQAHKYMSENGISEELSKDQRRKAPFDLDAPTDDISRFITMYDPFKKATARKPHTDFTMLRSKHDVNPVSGKFMDMLRSSDFYSRLSFVSAIVEELNFSSIRFSDPDTFIVKKVPGYKAWLLIKTVSPETHIHFSILMRTKSAISCVKPFRCLDISDKSYSCTDFMSINRMKISHLIGCHERMASIAAFWIECYGLSIERFFEEQTLRTKQNVLLDVSKMVNASICIFLEMSNKTSQDLQQVRYAYMEVCCKKLEPANPLKILRKLNDKIRSRLNVFFQQKILSNFPMMTNIKCHNDSPDMEDNGPSKFDLTFEGLINFITGDSIPRFNIALNLSYLGYMHIKGDFEKNQGLWKVYSKIISEEISARNFSLDKCVESPYDTKENHNFSIPFVKTMAAHLDIHLTKSMGESYKTTLYNDWVKMMSSMSLESLASLKASAIRPDEQYIRPINGSADERTTFKLVSEYEGVRTKVLARVAEKLKIQRATHLWECMESIMTDLMSKGSVYADLFQKQQIGGVREIFILDLESRMMILMTETLCRCIGKYLPAEMMTKPDMKSVASRNHHKMTKEMKESMVNAKSVTLIDSGDCTTWAQQFVMPVFWIVISKVCPPELMSVLKTMFNLHASKKLQLPTLMLTKFMSSPNIKSFDPSINELKDQFLGRSQHCDLMQPMSRLMNNVTNMAQGILHYMSSVYHCAFKLTMSHFNEVLTKNLFSGQLSFHRTDKVSSDDFSCLRTIVWSSGLKKTKKKIAINNATIASYLTKLSKYEEYCMKLACIKQSNEKSTIGAMNFIEEFNSQFMVSNSLMTPLIKFMYVSTELKAEESMSGRFHLLSNLRKQIPENGGSLLLTACVQSSQEMLHYISLGMNSNPNTFEKYLRLQKDLRCVSLGMMPLEPEGMCGLVGHNLAYYLKVNNDVRCNLSESYFYKKAGYTVAENGTPYIRVSVLLGQARTARQFIKKTELPEDWREVIELNPRCLFFGPTNSDEALSLLMMKMAQPGSYSSFSYMSPNKAYSPACYILDHPCVTFVEMDRLTPVELIVSQVEEEEFPELNKRVEPTEEERTDFSIAVGENTDELKLTKTSLIRALREITHEHPLSDLEIRLLFPHFNFYNDMLARVETLSRSRSSYKTNLPSRKSVEVAVPRSEATSLLPALKCCRLMWYSRSDVDSHYKLRESWRELKDKLPWLRETLSGTITNPDCPFKTAIHLYNYISGISLKVPIIRVQGNLSIRDDSMSTIYSILRNCYDPCMRRGDEFVRTARDIDGRRVIDREMLYNESVSKLSIASKSDNSQEKRRVLDRILGEYAGEMLSSDLYYNKTDQMRLLVIARHYKRWKMEKERARLGNERPGYDAIADQLRSDLLKSGVGQIIYWRQVAKLVDDRWEGRAVLRVESQEGKYEIVLNDDSIDRVIVKDMKNIRLISMDILSKLKRHEYTKEVTTRRVVEAVQSRERQNRILASKSRANNRRGFVSIDEHERKHGLGRGARLMSFSTGAVLELKDVKNAEEGKWVLVEEGIQEENYRFNEMTVILDNEELLLRNGKLNDKNAYNLVRLKLRPNQNEFRYFSKEEADLLNVPYATEVNITPADVDEKEYQKMFKERLRYHSDSGSSLKLNEEEFLMPLGSEDSDDVEEIDEDEMVRRMIEDEANVEDMDIADIYISSFMEGEADEEEEEIMMLSENDDFNLSIELFNMFLIQREEQYTRTLYYCLKNLDWLFDLITKLEDDDKNYLMSALFRRRLDPEWTPRFTNVGGKNQDVLVELLLNGIEPLVPAEGELLAYDNFKRPGFKDRIVSTLEESEMDNLLAKMRNRNHRDQASGGKKKGDYKIPQRR